MRIFSVLLVVNMVEVLLTLWMYAEPEEPGARVSHELAVPVLRIPITTSPVER